MVIQNGFTYIAFLMFLAGVLLAAEKYTKWKVFNIIPPLVWLYVLNMIFCTAGLYNSDGCSAAYSVLKNNLLYAMIFVMLLRCDIRKLAKLGGRMAAIFLGGALSILFGFIVAFVIFKGIFMKLQRRGRLGLLIDTWDMFLLSSKILDAAVCRRVPLCGCKHSCQKPESITPCRTTCLMR